MHTTPVGRGHFIKFPFTAPTLGAAPPRVNSYDDPSCVVDDHVAYAACIMCY